MTQLINETVIVRHHVPMDWHKKIWSSLAMAYQNHKTRKQLKDLPDYLLKDIGLDKEIALKEANRSSFSPLIKACSDWRFNSHQ